MSDHGHGSQASPIANGGPSAHDLVTADLAERKAFGLRKYGTLLQPNNGRDHLQDAYEEALDLACYLRNEIEQRRGGEPARKMGRAYDGRGEEWLETDYGWWCPKTDFRGEPSPNQCGLTWQHLSAVYGPMTDHQQSCGRGVCGGMMGHPGSCADTFK